MQTIQRHIIHTAIAEQAMIFIDARREDAQDDFMFEMHLI